MSNPTRPDLGAILTDMRDTGLEWLADAADTIEAALTGQTYEYAVRGRFEGLWFYMDIDATRTMFHDEITWFDHYDEAEKLKEQLSGMGSFQIVRRPVGGIEVVE